MGKDVEGLKWDIAAFTVYILYTIKAHIRPTLFNIQNQGRKTEYVLPKPGVPTLVVMLSIARVSLGIRSVLGFSSEMVYRGSGMWETIYGMLTAVPLVCMIFIPVYYDIGVRTVYEYLDLRFNSRLVRCIASGTYVLRQLCMFGITIYTPCISLRAITGIDYHISIGCTTFIIIFLTIIEGVTANTQAEFVQVTLVIISVIAIITRGTVFCGGVTEVYNINLKYNRLTFLRRGNTEMRVTTFTAWLGQLFISLSQFGCQQNFLTRYLRLQNVRDVVKAMMFSVPVLGGFFCMSWLMGMVCFATYAECDPLQIGYIEKIDEILPFFVGDRMEFIPGFVGLFMGLLYNGAIIVTVVGLEPLSSIIWVDYLSVLPPIQRLSDYQEMVGKKMVTVLLGIGAMFIAYSVGNTAGVIEATLLALSGTTGVLLGVFLLAMLIPIANWKGATVGMLVSFTFEVIIIMGRFVLEKDPHILPSSTAGCDNFTFAFPIPTGRSVSPHHGSFIEVKMAEFIHWLVELLRDFTHISFMYYSFMGTTVTIVVGIIISLQTQNYIKDQYEHTLLHPVIFKMSEYIYGNHHKPYYIGQPRRDSRMPDAASFTDLDPTKFAELRRDTIGPEEETRNSGTYFFNFRRGQQGNQDSSPEPKPGTSQKKKSPNRR